MTVSKKIITALTMTVAMGFANLSFAAPVTATTTTTTVVPAVMPSVTKATTITTVKKPHKTKKTVKTTVLNKGTGFNCKDGSHSNAKSTRGACSGHGGIAK